MTDFVAYYRVSTDKQGAQGLGMDAQREAVSRFIGQRGAIVGNMWKWKAAGRTTAPA